MRRLSGKTYSSWSDNVRRWLVQDVRRAFRENEDKLDALFAEYERRRSEREAERERRRPR